MSKKVTIGFERDKDYRLIPVHGVWGGITPNGDIVADLYAEWLNHPEEVTMEIDPPEFREIERKGERHVRLVMASLALRPDVAYALGRWLLHKAETAGYVPPAGSERH